MDCYGHPIFKSHFFWAKVSHKKRQNGKNDGKKKGACESQATVSLVSINAVLDTSLQHSERMLKNHIFDLMQAFHLFDGNWMTIGRTKKRSAKGLRH
jgi:hypothetical protein